MSNRDMTFSQIKADHKAREDKKAHTQYRLEIAAWLKDFPQIGELATSNKAGKFYVNINGNSQRIQPFANPSL